MATITVLFDASGFARLSSTIHFRGFPFGTRLIVVSEHGSSMEINFDVEADCSVEVRWDGDAHQPARVAVNALIPTPHSVQMMNMSMQLYPGTETIWYCPGKEPTLHELLAQDILEEERA